MYDQLLGFIFAALLFLFQDWWRKKDRIKELKEESVEKDKQFEIDKENIQNSQITQLVELAQANNKQDLYDAHKIWINEGYMPGYVKETIHKKYDFYHSNGGNGVGTKMYNEMMNLPEYKRKED